MLRVSLLASGNSLSIERTASGDLLRRRWLAATLRRIILPEPVTLTRFAIAVCVFNFCFMTYFLLQRGIATSNRSITIAPSKAQRSLSPERYLSGGQGSPCAQGV